MCTRVFYEADNKNFITGRSMDWSDTTMATDFWVYPRGISRNGGVNGWSPRWTSKYASLTVSIYNIGTADGINEKGLAGNMLFLAESDYGEQGQSGKAPISVGAWLQYMLDHYATVQEAVDAMKSDPFTVVGFNAPNGSPANVHLALSDATGDSVIFEYLGGELHIHHSSEYKVMTNSPSYDKQLAISGYWDLIGGLNFLPGTINAADRFARASYNLKSTPILPVKDGAIEAVFSQMRAISTPLGMSDPEKANISSTLWRTITDHSNLRYYFDSVIDPSVFWIEISDFNLSAGASAKTLNLLDAAIPGGKVASLFVDATPFSFNIPQI